MAREKLPTISTTPRGVTPGSGVKPKARRGVLLGDIERVQIEWLWKPFLQRGALNVLTGDPGVGKSTIVCDIAARLSRGLALPGGDPQDPMNVWIMNGEDDKGDTISWRLDNQGADPKRVWVTDIRETLTANVIKALKAEVAENRIRFLVIDPLQAWMGKEIDMNRANETREWGAYLRALAVDCQCAVLLCRHRRKVPAGAPENSLYSGMGSIDITGFARSEMSAIRAKDQTTYVSRTKHNVGGSAAFQYIIEQHTDPKNQHGVLKWVGEYVPVPKISRTPAKLTPAQDWLKERLKDGPVPAMVILKEAADKGISERTLQRAKVGIAKSYQSGPGEWKWMLLPELRAPEKELSH